MLCPYPKNVTEAELERNGLINLSRNLRQYSFQAEALLLLAAFGQDYSENQEQNWSRKILNMCHLYRNRAQMDSKLRTKRLQL